MISCIHEMDHLNIWEADWMVRAEDTEDHPILVPGWSIVAALIGSSRAVLVRCPSMLRLNAVWLKI